MSALLAFVLGLWIGSGWVWWQVDAVMTITNLERLWRAVTWLPLTIRNWFFGIFDR